MQPAGHIDKLGCDITGWAFDPRNRKILLVLDDTVINVEPKIERMDILETQAVPTPHVGFCVPFASALSRWRAQTERSSQLPQYVALTAGRDILDTRSLPSLSDFRGRLTGIDGGHITGWISGSACRSFAVEIVLDVDGVELGRVLPVKAHPGRNHSSGAYFFYCPLPLSPSTNASFAIGARVAITDQPLENSPLTIELPPSDHTLYYASQAIFADKTPSITIIIPVHNAALDLAQCVESVVTHTTRAAQLLIIDDASTDPAVEEVLDRAASLRNVIIVRNERNLGFAATANKGFKLSYPADVVLLNSDTIVPPRWLQNLRFAAYGHSATGTVTAISNNAGAFSAPKPNVDNPIPSSLTSGELGRLISQTSLGLLPEAPTANGFCMYIKRACLTDVGPFEDETFAGGYGEENDFSMRALRDGWRHVVDDRTIVLHSRSASFGLKRYSRAKLARSELEKLYPEYPLLVRSFLHNSMMRLARYRVRRALATANQVHPRTRLLTVISTTTGGTPQTNADLARALVGEYDVFVLASDRQRISLSQLADGGFKLVAEARLSTPITLSKHVSTEYDTLVASWLVRFAIELVHIRHIAWHGLGLTWVCRELDIPVIFSFHDYYAVCPTVKLLDEKLTFCGGSCTAGSGKCMAELWEEDEVPPLKHRWVHTWRQQTEAMLEPVNTFVTSSESARKTILSSFPSIAERPFVVIPHGRDFDRFAQSASRPNPKRPIRLIAPGNLSVAKGAGILTEIVELDRNKRLEIHTMGLISSELQQKNLVHHGSYDRDRFIELIENIKPSFGLILSIWPETYCHTLTELWAAGVPVVAFDFGAVGDRIGATGGGVLVRKYTPAAVYEAILNAAADVENHDALMSQVRDWQCREGRRNTTAAMAAAYSEIYSAALRNCGPFKDDGTHFSANK